MAARKKAPAAAPAEDQLTETSIKVGKALARSSFKVEDTGRRAKKVAEGLVETVTRKKKTVKPGDFEPAAGLTVEAQLGFVAGDIYQLLENKGATPVETVVKTMVLSRSTEAVAHAALGWLAREGKISFSADGITLKAT